MTSLQYTSEVERIDKYLTYQGVVSNQLMDRVEHTFKTSIRSNDDLPELAFKLCETLGMQLNLEDCCVFEVDMENLLLRQVCKFENKLARYTNDNPFIMPLSSGVCGFVALRGSGMVVPNTLHEPLYLRQNKLNLSEISVPLKVGNYVYGVIDCESSHMGFFTERHYILLNRLAKIFSQNLYGE
jgi:hypothetical protein